MTDAAAAPASAAAPESGPEEILDQLLPLYLRQTVYSILAEAVASEQLSASFKNARRVQVMTLPPSGHGDCDIGHIPCCAYGACRRLPADRRARYSGNRDPRDTSGRGHDPC